MGNWESGGLAPVPALQYVTTCKSPPIPGLKGLICYITQKGNGGGGNFFQGLRAGDAFESRAGDAFKIQAGNTVNEVARWVLGQNARVHAASSRASVTESKLALLATRQANKSERRC